MNEFHYLIIPPELSVIEAMATIDKGGKQIAFICRDSALLATLSDGDIRRYILKNGDLNAHVLNVGNQNYVYGKPSDSADHLENMCNKQVLNCIPIITADGFLIDVYFQNKNEDKAKPQLNTPVVIMAGGKGLRLYPYTKILPKPLIPIGDLTITEHIIKSFGDYNCNEISMIVNHKKDMIKAYFSESQSETYNIAFYEEKEPLGTGGGLSLIKNKIKKTSFLTNCDILLFENYEEILKAHNTAGNVITVVCSTKKFSIPYGAIEIDSNGQITSLTEKPSYSHLVNTGFYVIEPSFVKNIPDNTFFHITDLILECIKRNENVGIYPISEENWADMGEPSEMDKMQKKLEL